MQWRVFTLMIVGAWLLIPRAADAAGKITVTIRDEFGKALTAGGGQVQYSCGGATAFTVSDGSGSDLNSSPGVIDIQPVTAADCSQSDTVTVTVKNLGSQGYLAWQTQGTYSESSDLAVTSFNPFTVKVQVQDEFGAAHASASAAGSFTVAVTNVTTTTVTGHANDAGDAIGYPVPVATKDGGSVTVTGFGAQGLVNQTIEGIFVPDTEFENQYRVFSGLPFTVMILGKDELGGNLRGSGGSATFLGSPSVPCLPDTGTGRFGCAVPAGSSAAPVVVTKPGYVTYTIGSVTPPSSGSNTQVQAASANLFPVRVLGVASEFGSDITPTSTSRTPFLSAGGEIREMRYSGGTWFLAITPGQVQLTSQVPGYANTAVGVPVSSVGTITADYDGETGTKWGAQADGPPLELDMRVTVKDAIGNPVSGATVGIYASTTNITYFASDLADDYSVPTLGSHDAQKLTDANGIARFALDTGAYYYHVEKSGVGSYGNLANPAIIGYIETGGPYRVNVTLTSGGGAGTVGGAGGVSTSLSSIAANPVILEANNADAAAVTVTIRDGFDRPLPGQSVSVTSSRGSADTITATSPSTNSAGEAFFTIRSGTIGTPTLTASVGPTIVGRNVWVSFLEPSAVPQTFAPGALIKLADDNDPSTWSDTTVYYVANNGKRYFFPNEKTYRSWYPDYSGVRIVSALTMSSIPFGGVIHYRPGARMLKVQSDPRVYAVARGGVLRWVTTEDVARALYGLDWNRDIDDLSDALFVNYRLGAAIAGSGEFSVEGELAGVSTVSQNLGL